MKSIQCLIVAMSIAFLASHALADWPPTELGGAWRVTSTSEDALSGVAVPEMLLLVKDHLIFVEAGGPSPSAYGYALSEYGANAESYRALLHMPTVAVMPNGVRRNDVSKDWVVFSIKRTDDGVSAVTVELSEPQVRVRATRMSKQAASDRIKAILETPGFDCIRKIRRLLERYTTQTP